MTCSFLCDQLFEDVSGLARRAGEEIMAVRRDKDWQTGTKADATPVTLADRRADRILVDGLAKLDLGPVLSEESRLAGWSQRRQWSRYWLVDPLDGTREFLLGSDQFTVNIALIENGAPLLGIILQPPTGELYAACLRRSLAYKENAGGGKSRLGGARARAGSTGEISVLVSRHYGEAEIDPILPVLRRRYAGITVECMGSALKFCRLAEGSADIYCRCAPCREWDTAAGQAILEAVGGGVCGFDGQPLVYNRRADLMSPGFYAVADGRDWSGLFDGLSATEV